MIRPGNIYLFVILLISCIFCNSQNQSSITDWPQWRGPGRDGVWNVKISIDSLKPDNIKKIWNAPVGPGYSGPTVTDKRVYVMDYIKEPLPSERVHCFDALSGKSLWTYEYPCEYYAVGYPLGPRASVLINENMAYSFGTMGHLFCFNALSGDVIWQHNTLEEYSSRIPVWGLASSPVIEKNLVIVQAGGQPNACIMAFNKYTGDEIWRALEDEASYSAPVIIDQAGKKVLICWTGENVAGLNPSTGEVYWKIPFTQKRGIINIATPVYSKPYLFVSSFWDGSMLIRLDQNKLESEKVWHRVGEDENNTDALHCCISTPVIKGDYIYGIDSYGEFRCLDLLTGNRIWESFDLIPYGRWANVHFVRQGEKVWAFNERGELILGELTPEKFKDYGRVSVIKPVKISPHPRNGVCWAHPAYAGNYIYLRNDEELICISLQ
jgi:outer membrane protein assembly factor BamB